MKTIFKALFLLVALSAATGCSESDFGNSSGSAQNSATTDQSDFEATKTRAEAGYANAQYNLGIMYARGEVVAQDFDKAVTWYRLAADQGLAEAQNTLAYMYENGRGVEQNNQEAIRWKVLAAEQGNLDAQFSLGLSYATGSGVEKDDVEAFKWIRLAAAQNRIAQTILCLFYRDGSGTPQNYSRAYVWCSVAAAQSDYDGAVAYRDAIRNLLTPQQLVQAQAQATRCFESNFKDCE
jgi:uncharacterized protein